MKNIMKKTIQVIGRHSLATALLFSAATSWAGACRVTDFTDRTLSSLNEVQRLSFVTEMTQTEFNRLSKAQPGEDNHYQLISDASSVSEARQTAWEKLKSMGLENFDDYRRIWASDFLSAEQLEEFTNCTSSRQPGLMIAGRAEDPENFRITFAHITPIGIEQITTRVVASHNISNIGALEDFLEVLGAQDNYDAQTFVLRKSDPEKRAVLILRAGWETPDFVYIPVYPTPDYFSESRKRTSATPAKSGAGH